SSFSLFLALLLSLLSFFLLIFFPVLSCVSPLCVERRLHENFETGHSSITTISNLQQIFSFLLSLGWLELWTCAFLLQLYGSLSLLTCFLILPLVTLLRVVFRAYLIDFIRMHSQITHKRKTFKTAGSSSSSVEFHLPSLLPSDRYEPLQDKEEEEREGEVGKQVNVDQEKREGGEEEEERRLTKESIQDELRRFHESLKMNENEEHERLVNREEKEEEEEERREKRNRRRGDLAEEDETSHSSLSMKVATEAFLSILEGSTTFWGPCELQTVFDLTLQTGEGEEENRR
ncbi:transmembrane protein, partial [Cystoisospora suis]